MLIYLMQYQCNSREHIRMEYGLTEFLYDYVMFIKSKVVQSPLYLFTVCKTA